MTRKRKDCDEAYEAHKAQVARRQRRQSAAGRDIGAIPAPANPENVERARGDFRFFCETYFPDTFYLPWSDDHLKVIAKIEQAILRGGLFALAMPRGSGKSTLAEISCIWAMLIGAHDFVCLVGSDAGHARAMLESIKIEFETNDLLLADYPEAVKPIRSLERIHNRAKGQTCQGEHTRIVWTADGIVLPTVEGSDASGSIIRVAGIESRIRGMKYKRADGKSVRPSLVVIDDPQTDESARSPHQVKNRLETLNGAILNLAGPGQKISGIMPCTVIRPDDMADRILDRDAHPAWQGERTKLVYSFPDNSKLWDQYSRIRNDSFKADGDGQDATEFYGQNRAAMDMGAKVAWPQRFNEDELSAIQHAMNLRMQDERAFWAEYQNEPIKGVEGDDDIVTAEQIAAKVNNHPRRSVPIGVTYLTMFIDVHGKLLYYAVLGWEEDFTGYVVDYGAYPDQRKDYYSLAEAKRTLALAAPAAGLEGSIYAGLEKLTADIIPRRWEREDGSQMQICRCLIDANWGQSTDVVYQFCKQSPHSAIVTPSHGKFVGASSVPFAEYKRKKGERAGHHWRMPNTIGKRQVRHVVIDVNYWKSFIHSRLAVSMGDPGCLSLFGNESKNHQLFADHLTAEYRVKTEARGRVIDEWKWRATRADNHWLDCVVGCAAGASIEGACMPGVSSGHARPRRKKVKLSEIQRKKRQWEKRQRV